MALSNKKKLVLALFLFVLFITIPMTVSLLHQKQEQRSRASGSTNLSFDPATSSSSPFQTNVNSSFSLNLKIDPGSNLVTFVRFQVKYDPTKVQLSTTNPFTLNTGVFPTKVEGPIVDAAAGTVAESVDVGSDPTKAVQKVSDIGTLNFTAVGTTGTTPTQITYTSLAQVLSSGANDQAAENVLESTTPAYVLIGDGTLPTTNPSEIISPSPSNELSPAPTPVSTFITLSLLLHGVGAAGDNPNPNTSDLSNKNPLHPQRDTDVQIINSSNQIVASIAGSVIFSTSGTFDGIVDLGPNFPTGNYTIKVKTERYLRKLIPGIQKITNLAVTDIPPVGLVAGDVNDDNTLNVLDYNALLDCGYGEINPLPMQDPGSIFNTGTCQVHTPVLNVDLDDDGIIDSSDYNLFLRELSVQNGD